MSCHRHCGCSCIDVLSVADGIACRGHCHTSHHHLSHTWLLSLSVVGIALQFVECHTGIADVELGDVEGLVYLSAVVTLTSHYHVVCSTTDSSVVGDGIVVVCHDSAVADGYCRTLHKRVVCKRCFRYTYHICRQRLGVDGEVLGYRTCIAADTC